MTFAIARHPARLRSPGTWAETPSSLSFATADCPAEVLVDPAEVAVGPVAMIVGYSHVDETEL